MKKTSVTAPLLIRDISIALAVSFVAISLGASLGILSGRGAFAGMVSAGVIAFVTSLAGGTRIQCSGPTAPISAVTATVVAFAFSDFENISSALTSDQFITLVLLMMAGVMMIFALLRLGRLITLIPRVVVSGFMDGIALLIWAGQIKKLFGLSGEASFAGPLWINLALVVGTVALMFAGPALLKKYRPKIALYLPGSLIGIILASLIANALTLPVQYTALQGSIANLADIRNIFTSQWPAAASWNDIATAIPYALKLALLCYLDTLLTSRIIDKMTREKTRQNQELAAQGLANGLAALMGGIPGAQATIRSVLMVKEGAATRVCGILVGLFVLVEILMFQDYFSYIPAAVFSGVLFKIGYDVFDWQPVKIYAQELSKQPRYWRIGHTEMAFIIGTMVATILLDLNMAVIGFTLLFYALNKLWLKTRPIPDLTAVTETEGIRDEP